MTKKYICLMRGINVGGKNMVTMATLKSMFEGLGFTKVQTYINSGNILFQSDETDTDKLADLCHRTIFDELALDIGLMVLEAAILRDAIEHAPDWWAKDPDSTHNALFVIPPATSEEIVTGMGNIKPDYEKLAWFGPVIFWTAALATYSRTRWSQLVKTQYYKSVTIRNAKMHGNLDHTIWEGVDVKGYPVATYSRGNLVFKDDKFVGEKGAGKMVKCKPIRLKGPSL